MCDVLQREEICDALYIMYYVLCMYIYIYIYILDTYIDREIDTYISRNFLAQKQKKIYTRGLPSISIDGDRLAALIGLLHLQKFCLVLLHCQTDYYMAARHGPGKTNS